MGIFATIRCKIATNVCLQRLWPCRPLSRCSWV